MQSSLWVEHVREAEQVVLVGPTAVVEDEQAVGRAGRRPFAVGERAHVVDPMLDRVASQVLVDKTITSC